MIPIPKHANDETRLAAARFTAKALIDEAGVEGNVDEMAADIARHCRFGDGYQMARELECHGWSCDMAIAQVLDDHRITVDMAHHEYLAKYQKEHDIQPPHPVGSAVRIRLGIGVIDSVYAHRPLSYAIKLDEDEAAGNPNNRQIIVWFDEVEAIPPSGEAV